MIFNTEVAATLRKHSKVMVLAVGDAEEAEEIKKIASKPLELYGKHLESFRDLQDLQMFVFVVKY